MRCLLFSRAPFVGGAEVACERLALGLIARGHEASVIVERKNDVFNRYISVGLQCHVFRLPLRSKTGSFLYPLRQLRLRKFIKQKNPDIIYSNDLPTHQFVSSVARNIKVPRVCHHRFIYDRACIDWLNRLGADRHVFVSNYLKELLCSESTELSSQATSVIYDGLPLGSRVTQIEKRNARNELGIDSERKLVVFAGQIIERKGIRELLDAWKIVQTSRSNVQLILIGDDIQNAGAFRKAMVEYARQQQIDVQFAGFQRNVMQWLTAADIAVVPSREEPLGNATLEAMAASLPVIGTNTGGIPEMVCDGKTGLLVPVNASDELSMALIHLIDNPGLARQLGENGRVRCEIVFSLESHIDSMLKLFSDLLITSGR